MCLRLAAGDDRRVAVVHAVCDGPLGVELFALLVVVRDLEAGALLDRAVVGLQSRRGAGEAGRLPGAVRAVPAEAIAAEGALDVIL